MTASYQTAVQAHIKQWTFGTKRFIYFDVATMFPKIAFVSVFGIECNETRSPPTIHYDTY